MGIGLILLIIMGAWAGGSLFDVRENAIKSFVTANKARELGSHEVHLYIPPSLNNDAEKPFLSHAYEFSIEDNKVVIMELSIGSGNASRKFTTASFRTIKKYPHIYLDGLRSGLTEEYSKKKQRISLEGDFDKHFQLFASSKSKSASLAIITPDLMSTIIETGSAYDIEIDDRLVSVIGSGDHLTETRMPNMIVAVIALMKEVKHKDRTWQPISTDNYSMGLVPRKLTTSYILGLSIIFMSLALLFLIFYSSAKV